MLLQHKARKWAGETHSGLNPAHLSFTKIH
jgi:hypothetical protein